MNAPLERWTGPRSRSPWPRPLRGPPPVTVTTNVFTPYLRSRFGLHQDRLLVCAPRTFLGLLAIGRREVSLRLVEVRGIRVEMRLRAERLVVLLGLLAVTAEASGGWWGLRLALAALAAWLVPLTYIAVLSIETEDGRRLRFPVCWLHRFDVELFARAVRAEALEWRGKAVT
jgi:hypothetical protein